MTTTYADADHARLNAEECKRRGTHVLDEENNWCHDCDTGECNDCGRRIVWVEKDGWYHHIDRPEEGCFLIAAEDDFLRRADGSIYGRRTYR